MVSTSQRNTRKTRTGMVVSNAMQKTIIVRAEQRTLHPVYGKVVRRFKKFYAHDEKGEAQTGDKVVIVETRPYSRLKRWRLERVLEKAAKDEVGHDRSGN